MFIYFLWRERYIVRAGKGERETHTLNRSRLQALSCQHRARHGAQTHEPQDHDLSQSQTLNRQSHPSAATIILSLMDTCLSMVRRLKT